MCEAKQSFFTRHSTESKADRLKREAEAVQ